MGRILLSFHYVHFYACISSPMRKLAWVPKIESVS